MTKTIKGNDQVVSKIISKKNRAGAGVKISTPSPVTVRKSS